MYRFKDDIIFPNGISLDNHLRFLQQIVHDMLNDLSTITGVDQDFLLEDYKYRNSSNIMEELFKEKGIGVNDRSLALRIAKLKGVDNIE